MRAAKSTFFFLYPLPIFFSKYYQYTPIENPRTTLPSQHLKSSHLNGVQREGVQKKKLLVWIQQLTLLTRKKFRERGEVRFKFQNDMAIQYWLSRVVALYQSPPHTYESILRTSKLFLCIKWPTPYLPKKKAQPACRGQLEA